MPVRYIMSSVWVRFSIFSQLSIKQYMGLCVFSLPISLVLTEKIYTLLIIIINSEVWTIINCSWLGNETMPCAVCLYILILMGFPCITFPTRIFCRSVSGFVIGCPLRWRHNDHAGVSNHQPHGCLLNRLFRRKSKKTSKLRVTGLCAGNSPGTGEFPAQMASYAENVSIWWRHHACGVFCCGVTTVHRGSFAKLFEISWSVSRI